MTPYTPRGNPRRVIEYLRTLPDGTEQAQRVICDALDIDAASFVQTMQSVLGEGLIEYRKVGTVNYWRLTEDAAQLAHTLDGRNIRVTIFDGSALVMEFGKHPRRLTQDERRRVLACLETI